MTNSPFPLQNVETHSGNSFYGQEQIHFIHVNILLRTVPAAEDFPEWARTPDLWRRVKDYAMFLSCFLLSSTCVCPLSTYADLCNQAISYNNIWSKATVFRLVTQPAKFQKNQRGGVFFFTI